jgi:hypothetical protein
VIAILIGSLLALGCLFGAFFNFKRKRTIDDLPTSKTQGVFLGQTELKGTAESETPLTSYLAGSRCVYYDWNVEEHWSRTVTETHTDSKGHTSTTTRTESGWKKVAGDTEAIPFYLEDDSGIIRIVSDKARINANRVFNETVGRESSLYFDKGPLSEVANSSHRRRFQESAIPLHTALYLLGQAREREDIVAAEIAYDKGSPLFLISTRTEKQISSGYGRWFGFWLALGLAVMMGGVALSGLLSGGLFHPGAITYIEAAAGYLIVFGLGWLGIVYNSLINLRHRVEQGWSQVDVQLKRRNDLIQNLIRTVEAYRDYERETQQLVTEMRGQLTATPPGITGPDYQGIAPALRVVVENYPGLKSSELFLKLQDNLVDTEQRIALARDYFNQIATFYNTRLGIIPDRYVGALARMQQKQLLSARDFERASVLIKLES